MLDQIDQHVYRRYEIIEKLGKGAYGVVWKAIDRNRREIVALKKVVDAFHNASDAQRTYRQISILKQLKGHPNIIRILNVMRSNDNKDLYLVFEFMEIDLNIIIKSSCMDYSQKLYFSYQLIKGIEFVHNANVIHRDLKPSNVLANMKCQLKIGDFGLARTYTSGVDLTDYVATRWYRAPQILLGSVRYSKQSDMWAVGCILAQFFVGQPLFRGNNTINQIQKILEVIGKPSSREIQQLNSPLASDIINGLDVGRRRINFANYISDPNLVKMIESLLNISPKRRASASEAIKSPVFKEFKDEEVDVYQAQPVSLRFDDCKRLALREYREGIYEQLSKCEEQQKSKLRQFMLQRLDRR